jgi:hypothetical protein
MDGQSRRPQAVQQGGSNSETLQQQQHPVRAFDIDILLSEVNNLVSLGVVERYKHEETGLEVFSYTSRNKVHLGECRALTVDMCRGLIVHPVSKTIVATPFVRFFKPRPCDIQQRGEHIVRASIKYDGSLIIAFKWNGALFASTRRRMNSEQALWATEWLQHSALAQQEFKAGWTYLLELVGGDNVHVTPYTMRQTLILLTAFDQGGVEVTPCERAAIAVRVGVPSVPALQGRLSDIAQLVQGRDSTIIGPVPSGYAAFQTLCHFAFNINSPPSCALPCPTHLPTFFTFYSAIVRKECAITKAWISVGVGAAMEKEEEQGSVEVAATVEAAIGGATTKVGGATVEVLPMNPCLMSPRLVGVLAAKMHHLSHGKVLWWKTWLMECVSSF